MSNFHELKKRCCSRYRGRYHGIYFEAIGHFHSKMGKTFLGLGQPVHPQNIATTNELRKAVIMAREIRMIKIIPGM